MIRTRFTELFDIDHPVMSAPMAMHCGGTLAGAVSAAGALGSFCGMHLDQDEAWVHDQTAIARAATDRPFAVGFITPFLPMAEANLEATLDERPAAVCFSFSDPGRWAAKVREAGLPVICQVQDLDGAAAAIDGGADVLIAQGAAAGGHTGTMSLLPFLTGIVDRYPDVPVLAAGGIGDGRALAAALLAGADGALMGTAFLATPEAVEIDDDYRSMIVRSDGTDTVLTEVYDIVGGMPWPEGIVDRVRRNRFTDTWHGREAELHEHRDEVSAELAVGAEDPDVRAIRFGPAAGTIEAVRPAGDVIRSTCSEAEELLRNRPGAILA